MKRSVSSTWLDRTIGSVAPRWQLQRLRARVATDLITRNYEAAAGGRRTQGWKRTSSDASAAVGPYVGRLRDVARELVRNNPYAEAALKTIVNHVVGDGIVAKPSKENKRAAQMWNDWANTTACDADGRHDFAGLQKLVMRGVAESGEVLVRRRFRRPEDNLPIPLQLQILEPDFLDTAKHGVTLPNGGRIVYGVEFDAIGRRAAYWLFPEHPGNSAWPSVASQRVPAEGIQHVFDATRPGAVRGVTAFAPVLLTFKDYDEFADATLMKQKVAACLAVITSDVDGTASPLGTGDDTTDPGIDSLEPGMILNVAPGRNVDVVQPPSVTDYAEYSRTVLRGIAAGIGVTYEDMTGDYSALPFSAVKASRMDHWTRVEDWRWRMLIPQFCDPVWAWAMQAADVMGLPGGAPTALWTANPMPMIEPDKEGLSDLRNVRAGFTTLSEVIRERGYDPAVVFAELAADMKKLDDLGLTLDTDPRKMTQAGQGQGASGSAQPDMPQSNAQRLFDELIASHGEGRTVELLDMLTGLGARR